MDSLEEQGSGISEWNGAYQATVRTTGTQIRFEVRYGHLRGAFVDVTLET